ncbi:hypothetical protein DFJ74DRAFT_465946 [Hyaloraphidium curvatum]|nr:hypothetical protein DFJ74DRAFT_465946 [Hyaloraphidium curvatum]
MSEPWLLENIASDVLLHVFEWLELEDLHRLSLVGGPLFRLLDSPESGSIWIRKFRACYSLLPVDGKGKAVLAVSVDGSGKSGARRSLANTGTASIQAPRKLYAALLRRYGSYLGIYQADWPSFRGYALRIALFEDGSIRGQRIEFVNALERRFQQAALSVRRAVTLDVIEPQLCTANVFRISLEDDKAHAACLRRGVGDAHALVWSTGTAAFPAEAAQLKPFAKFHAPNRYGLWPHPESNVPMPEDLTAAVFVGSLDDHSSVVVESLANIYFPSGNNKRMLTMHLSCELGCQSRSLPLYLQPFDATQAVPIPSQIKYTPSFSKIELESLEPIDIFPEPPIMPREGIWAGSIGPEGETEGRTALGLFLFRFAPVNLLQADDERDSDDDGMSTAMSMSHHESTTTHTNVDIESVLDLPPRLDGPPPPSPPRRRQPGTIPADRVVVDEMEEGEGDVHYELRAWSITGNMRNPRGELVFRASMSDAMTVSVRRDPVGGNGNDEESDDEDGDRIALDETPEFQNASCYEARMVVALWGYSSRRELAHDFSLIVLSEDEVGLFDSSRAGTERVYRFKRVVF